ncbi:MAG: 3-oxoacyl-[acyl-carrier-protein] reductase [Candidatus Omnitrophota bacterium]|nr:3-oxoacyl-[acyl-carrier-protein] reductase [Candidatus Omnitrophota bacterium]MDD5518872.1 3-oxoacyl-[acyl-carrier-protein] reductase [Candidatus Omnitrophota bacterium]
MFKDKVAIVTGGSRGIGRALVLMLAQEGADVAFTYAKSVQEAESLSSEIKKLGRKVLALQMDVADFDKAKELVEKVKEGLGSLDILVNNAGIIRDKALMMMTKDDWREVIDTNLNGTFNVTRNAIVTFLKQKSGSIVNITSVSGVAGMSRQTNYAASKAGIIGFTKSLAKEVAPYNIRVNAVAPGFIETDMISGLKDEFKEGLKKKIPLSRLGRVEDVSAAVKFLLSDAANFITGQTIIVDGGLFIQ